MLIDDCRVLDTGNGIHIYYTDGFLWLSGKVKNTVKISIRELVCIKEALENLINSSSEGYKKIPLDYIIIEIFKNPEIGGFYYQINFYGGAFFIGLTLDAICAKLFVELRV